MREQKGALSMSKALGVILGLITGGLVLKKVFARQKPSTLVFEANDVAGYQEILPSPVALTDQVRIVVRAALTLDPVEIGAGNAVLVGQGNPSKAPLSWALFWFGKEQTLAFGGLVGGTWLHQNLAPMAPNEWHSYEIIVQRDGLFQGFVDGVKMAEETRNRGLNISPGEPLVLNIGNAFYIQSLQLFI